jgi:hypothetical protein
MILTLKGLLNWHMKKIAIFIRYQDICLKIFLDIFNFILITQVLTRNISVIVSISQPNPCTLNFYFIFLLNQKAFKCSHMWKELWTDRQR